MARLKAEGHNSRAQLVTSRCRWLREEHLTRLQNTPILRPEPLLVQLSGLLGEEEFQHAFWEADRKIGLKDRRLTSCVGLSRGLRGGVVFRESVDCRLPHIEEARSLLEVLVMDLCRRTPLPEPAVNIRVEGRMVDFCWREQRLVVESDGYEFHRGHGSFERDAERDNDLRAAGWTVLRFTYRMIKYRPDYVAATVCRAMTAV